MYSVFEQLCQEKGVSRYQVSKDTGIAQSTLATWKTRGTDLSAKSMQKLADYFGVPVEYLISGRMPDDSGTYYTDEESRELANFLFQNPQYKTLFSAARNVRPEDLRMVQEILDRFAKPSYPDDPA